VPPQFLVAQISDLHIGGEWGGADPVSGARRVIEAVAASPDPPDAVVVTGDLVLGTLAGRPALTIPSTYVQARVDFGSPEIQLGPGPPGFAVHALVDGDTVSFLHTLGPTAPASGRPSVSSSPGPMAFLS
jgi:3',5'-cyclic AMP phosphodiesterase CpdA